MQITNPVKVCCCLVVGLIPALAMAADDGLIARYTFDEGSGSIAKDASGHGNDGKIVGAQWVKQGGGYALQFGRTVSYVDFGDNPNLKIASDMSVTAWVKLVADQYPNHTTNWHILNCEDYRHAGFSWRLAGSTGQLYYRSSQPDNLADLFSDAKLDNGIFHHVAFVKSGNRITFFVDGDRDAQTTTKDPAPGNNPFTLSDKSQSLEGILDEVRIYRTALSVGEIVALYKEGAESHGKDTSGFGKLKVTPYFRHAEATVIVEVNLKGILPLADGDEVGVDLTSSSGGMFEAKTVSAVSESGKSDFEFSLSKLPEGSYELRAVLRNGQTTKAEERIPFHSPPLPPVVPSPLKESVPLLPPALQPVRYSVEMCKGGGLRLLFQGQSYALESVYSYPNGGENRLSASESVNNNGEPEWNLKADKGDSSTYRVTAGGKYYVIHRQVELQPTRVLVKDTITNTSGADVGIILSNSINTREHTDVNRHTIPDIAPMVFLHGKDHGLGVVALDDVYRIQLRKTTGDGICGMGSDRFGLAKGDSYTLEWAVYPRRTGDYYDFINAVRKDEGLDNRTVDGCYSITHSGRWLRETPPRDLVECAALKYVSSGCLTKVADDPGISLEGFEFIEYPGMCQAMKNIYVETRKLYPGIRVMFHVAPHLRAGKLDDILYGDSKMLDRFGKHSLYDDPLGYFSQERLNTGWAFWPYYPTADNTYGKAMLQSVDVMMDDIGTNGVFADGLVSGYGAKGIYDGFTYDKWDGHSVEIDPASKTIKRKIGSVYLLGRDAILAYVRKVNAKGGRVIINEMNLFPKSLCKEEAFYNAETNDGDFRCAQMHLAPTVIGLAQPNKSSNELDVYNDIRAKIEWGALYAYYYWSCSFTHRTITAEMYPITVQEIRSGIIKGKERIITLHSGVYGWQGSRDLHLTSVADGRGYVTPAGFLTTVDRSGVRTQIALKENETAVLKRIPVSINAATPVNVVGERYDANGVRLSLNAAGRIVVNLVDGEYRIQNNTGYKVTAGRVFVVKSDTRGRLSIPIEMKGPMRLTITRVP